MFHEEEGEIPEERLELVFPLASLEETRLDDSPGEFEGFEFKVRQSLDVKGGGFLQEVAVQAVERAEGLGKATVAEDECLEVRAEDSPQEDERGGQLDESLACRPSAPCDGCEVLLESLLEAKDRLAGLAVAFDWQGGEERLESLFLSLEVEGVFRVVQQEGQAGGEQVEPAGQAEECEGANQRLEELRGDGLPVRGREPRGERPEERRRGERKRGGEGWERCYDGIGCYLLVGLVGSPEEGRQVVLHSLEEIDSPANERLDSRELRGGEPLDPLDLFRHLLSHLILPFPSPRLPLQESLEFLCGCLSLWLCFRGWGRGWQAGEEAAVFREIVASDEAEERQSD